MIYTSGTNRILTINEADNTKVGWVADKNDATNGKLVFSDADVNWSNNEVRQTTSVTLNYVSKMGNPFSIRDSDAGVGVYLQTTGYVFTSGLGAVCLWPTSNTFITRGNSYVTSTNAQIYNSNTTYRYSYASNLYIYNTKRPFVDVTGTGNSVSHKFLSPVMPEGSDPAASLNPITYSYSPSPILSVSQTKPQTFSLTSSNTYWTGLMTVYVYYVPYGDSGNIIRYSTTLVNCTIYRDGEIKADTTKTISLPTNLGVVMYLFVLPLSTGNTGTSVKTGRFYGTTNVTRSNGYAGTADILIGETGSASITQTS